jgi:hypothetical protein
MVEAQETAKSQNLAIQFHFVRGEEPMQKQLIKARTYSDVSKLGASIQDLAINLS